MFWLSLIVGIQFLGFAVTLTRLAFDEWRQWRVARDARKADLEPPEFAKVHAMQSEATNIIPFIQASDAPLRQVWQFRYPHQVVIDPSLDRDEKRAILAAWASDEHAVESMPTLRYLPGTPAPVTFSSIMEARAHLDRLSSAANDDDPPPLLPASKRCNRSFYLEAA